MIDRFYNTMLKKDDDPYVAEVREVRAQLNREANYDPAILAANATAFAKKLGMAISPLRPVMRTAPATA